MLLWQRSGEAALVSSILQSVRALCREPRLVPWLLQSAPLQPGPLVTVAAVLLQCWDVAGSRKGSLAEQHKAVLPPEPQLQGILPGQGLLNQALFELQWVIVLRGLNACILCTVYFTAHFLFPTACTMF